MSTKEEAVRARQKGYTERIHQRHLIEGWWWDVQGFKPRPDQPTEPGSPVAPYIWKWSEVGPLVVESGELIGVGQGYRKAERRVLVLSNPSLNGQYAVTNTLFADLQLVKPGEVAPSHRHTTTAARFIFAGTGGWTTVEGERVGPLAHGDLVVNPQWGWHDHGNEGPDDFVFLDVLDIPLLTALATATWEFDYVKVTGDPKKYSQPVTRVHYSPDLYASGGIVPKFVGSARRDHSPMIWYKWPHVAETLDRLRQEKGSPYDGVIIEFTNPETGGSVGPTMSICAQLLRPGERTLQHRHNTSTVYIAVGGQGYTIVSGTRIDWTRNDIFAVPSWTWHEHGNASSTEDASLFSVSEAPVIEKIGLYREQRKTASGEVEDTGWVANKYVPK